MTSMLPAVSSPARNACQTPAGLAGHPHRFAQKRRQLVRDRAVEPAGPGSTSQIQAASRPSSPATCSSVVSSAWSTFRRAVQRFGNRLQDAKVARARTRRGTTPYGIVERSNSKGSRGFRLQVEHHTCLVASTRVSWLSICVSWLPTRCSRGFHTCLVASTRVSWLPPSGGRLPRDTLSAVRSPLVRLESLRAFPIR